MEKDNVYSCIPVLTLFKVPEDCLIPKEIIKESQNNKTKKEQSVNKLDKYEEKTGNIDIRQTREYRVVVYAAAQMQQIQGYVEDCYIYELLKRYKIDYRKISIREVRSDISIYILRESDKYKEIVQKWIEDEIKGNRFGLSYEEITEEINSFMSYYNLDKIGITEQMFLNDMIKELDKKIEELEELEKK